MEQYPSPTKDDAGFMAIAMQLAHCAKGCTFPNPAVGAVVVKGDRIVGKGSTACCGGPHAERSALAMAGREARGATLYATLEPCCHHGRTPPCTDLIIESGIRRVVVAVADPNPLVSGKGLKRLRAAGVSVRTGLLEKEAAALNEDFFWSITRRSAWVTAKLALTLDGRIADDHGSARWITSRKARMYAHELRRRHAAVAVGKGTLVADNPRLTVRLVKGAQPARIVFSATDRLPSSSHFVRDAGAIRSIVVCDGGRYRDKYTRRDKIEVWHTGHDRSPESLRAFLVMAFEEGLSSILVEGGGILASAFMEQRLVNRLYLIYGNRILGAGRDGLKYHRGLPLGAGLRLDGLSLEQIDDNFVVTGLPNWG